MTIASGTRIVSSAVAVSVGLRSQKRLSLTTYIYSDLDSIRAITYQAKYLSEASITSEAYLRVCCGISASLKMGLHVSSRTLRTLQYNLSDEELFQRRRVFAVLHCMDAYMSSALGMPMMVKDAEHSETLGVREEDLADEGRSLVQQEPNSYLATTVLCQKLNWIVANIQRDRQTVARRSPPGDDSANDTSQESVMARAADLAEWHASLPELPVGPANLDALNAALCLRVWGSISQLVLYRPFLHHLTRDAQDPRFTIRGYEFGSACVRAAMQIVWINTQFRRYGLFHDAHWMNLYMLGFSASILTFFVASARQRETVPESHAAALKARDMLGELGRYSLPARRCCKSVSALLDALPTNGDRDDED